MGFFKDDLKKVRAFIFDVDGVLSHQSQNLTADGELIRTSCKVANKMEALDEIQQRYGLCREEIMYMGDDIPDYNVMTRVGLPVCPLDACEEIKSVARYISDIKGGDGCVRDVIGQVLKARGDWMDTTCYVKSM